MKFGSHYKCPLCARTSRCKNLKHPGYQQSTYFSIYHCKHCETAFALPMKIDQQLYNCIYSQIEDIPGYDRYLRYANEILNKEKPLEYLAEEEDIYWGIKAYLDKQAKKSLKILDVGCGFGYLTYALAKEGHDVRGLDISNIAVEQARKRYGDLFICSEVQEYARQVGPIYDIVISTEVIEHIPNVKSFLSSLTQLLGTNGKIILTTPNRSCYPKKVLWRTDLPPVHFWWFSERSISFLAKEINLKASFIDFTDYNKNENYTDILPNGNFNMPTVLPRLNEQGKPISPITQSEIRVESNEEKKITFKKMIKFVLNKFGLLKPIQDVKNLIYKNQPVRIIVKPNRSFSLCVILEKTNLKIH